MHEMRVLNKLNAEEAALARALDGQLLAQGVNKHPESPYLYTFLSTGVKTVAVLDVKERMWLIEDHPGKGHRLWCQNQIIELRRLS